MKNSVKVLLVILTTIAVTAVFCLGGFLLSICAKPDSTKWARETIEQYYYYADGTYDYTDLTVREIADKYLDIYSDYYTEEEYEQIMKSNAGSKSGIGVSYMFIKDKGVYLSNVLGNSPAYMCGLRAGDWLLRGKVKGKETVFKSTDDFADMVSGADDSDEITLVSVEEREYKLKKAHYTESYAYMATNSSGWIFKDSADGGLALYEESSEKLPFLPDGFAYISLSQFYGSASKEFYKLISKFNAEKCTSLIVDLRSNGGGYVSVMQEIAGCFSDGEVETAMLSRDKYGNEDYFDCEKVSSDSRVSKSVNVYAMANFGTASASEALLGAMICYGALDYEDVYISEYTQDYLSVVGSEEKNGKTYGKGIMQTPYQNPYSGEVLKLTSAKIYWPDEKTCIHDRGLSKADGCKTVKTEWDRTKGDKELQDVIKMITSENQAD